MDATAEKRPLAILGMDEAGYGPNLGPLVIACTTWRWDGTNDENAGGSGVPSYDDCEKRCERFAAALLRHTAQTGHAFSLGDSKTVYSGKRKLASLERVALAGLRAFGAAADSLEELLAAVDPAAASGRSQYPWYQGANHPLPVAATNEEVAAAEAAIRRALAETGLRGAGCRARVAFEGEFNRRLTATGNKADTHAGFCLELLTAAYRQAFPSAGGMVVWSDKWGGRAHYGPFIRISLATSQIECCCEGREESRYRWRHPENGAVTTLSFLAKGEARPPVGLASLVAKYLRELFMRQLNDYWARRVSGLSPTAGYPGDARRYLQAITPQVEADGIDLRILWRKK